MIYSRHRRALELDKILTSCATHAVCEDTKENIKNIRPDESFQKAKANLTLTSDAQSLLHRFGSPGLSAVQRPESKIKRARVGAALSMKDLLEIAGLLRQSRMLLNWRRAAQTEPTALDGLFEALTANETLEKDIYDAILSEDEMADDASPALSDIRRKIQNAHTRARATLERITRSRQYETYLQEQIITIRNGRFVVPVKAEHRSNVKGLVHDTSASGATVFIEPMAVVELNNAIKELEAEQKNEIHRILLAFSQRIAEFGDSLSSNYEVILALDMIFAKAKLADVMDAGPFALIEQGETHLRNARHPLIPQDEVVPIDIPIGGEFHTLVITGPNTGGKTVALKTLGLFALMAQCGLLLPCSSGSQVRYYGSILADIGDEQSIEQSLSTFSSHMTNIISILEHADENSLVLIDELGAGTDPVEGAALAVAILDQLRKQGSTIAATTHYPEIKMYALQTDGVENASCEFDVATLQPTYRLLIGTLGKSNAFAISQRLGLPKNIITAAEEHISADNRQFEDVVISLEETRQALEKEQEIARKLRLQAEQSKKDTEALRKDIEVEMQEEYDKAQEQARQVVATARFQYEEIMEELEELRKLQKQQGISREFADARGELRRHMRELEDTAHDGIQKPKSSYTLPRPLQQGDVVFLTGFNTEGTVLSPPDNRGNVRVQAGILETRVPVDSLRLVEDDKKVSFEGGTVRQQRSHGKRATASRSDSISELDLRGMDSLEATLEVERFIDASVLSNMGSVAIIHGKGTGVLRKTVQDYLRTHPSVANYRLGEYGEGGSGVTIAELK